MSARTGTGPFYLEWFHYHCLNSGSWNILIDLQSSANGSRHLGSQVSGGVWWTWSSLSPPLAVSLAPGIKFLTWELGISCLVWIEIVTFVADGTVWICHWYSWPASFFLLFFVLLLFSWKGTMSLWHDLLHTDSREWEQRFKGRISLILDNWSEGWKVEFYSFWSQAAKFQRFNLTDFGVREQRFKGKIFLILRSRSKVWKIKFYWFCSQG